MRALEPFGIDFSGINLVEASAGTGKTYNITSLFIRALIEREISVGNILVVTYTEAATKELKDRLLNRIREAAEVLKNKKIEDRSDQFLKDLLENVKDRSKAIKKLDKALRGFDEAAIYTIHGFCYQALQEQAFESRALYDSEMIGDDFELVLEVIDDYWRNWIAEITEDPKKHPLLTLLFENGYDPDRLAEELSPYIGKPYLKILPNNTDTEPFEQLLSTFSDLYARLQDLWFKRRNDLFKLLDTGNLSYYTTNKLHKWFSLMDEFLSSDSPQLNIFTQYYRFKQSSIDDSLKKGAVEKDIFPPQHDFFKLIDEYAEILESIQGYLVVFKKQLLLYLRDELKQKKDEQQVLSYDDLLLRFREALLDSQRGQYLAEKLRKKYPFALVDEFQDTDPVQYEIFREIYSSDGRDSALFMIGDPKQSIYSFRGADVFSYIEAREDAPRQNMFKLEKNFRSTPILIEGLNTFWTRHDKPFILDDISYEELSWGRKKEEYNSFIEYGKEYPPIRFRTFSEKGQAQNSKSKTEEKSAEDAANEIYRLIEDGKRGEVKIGTDPVQAKDIAVLVRTHKQAKLMSEVLQEKDIKSVQYSQESVFLSDEAHHLQIFLKAVAEPSNENLVKTALSLPLTSFTANELLDIEEDEQRWVEVLNQFAEWHRLWLDQGFAPMFRSVLQDTGIAVHIIGFPNGERRLTNILHLGELLQDEAQRQKGGTRSLLKWLARKRQEDGMQQDEEQLRLESDQELVKIVTMHRSKGLEYPIVFCPFLWYGPRFSDSGQPLVYHTIENKGSEAVLDLTGKSNPNRAENRFKSSREELAESLRLAYVAMTRAEHCLYLTWEYANSSEFSALGYLLQEPGKVSELLKQKLGNKKYSEPGDHNMRRTIENLCSNYPTQFTRNIDFKRDASQLDLLEKAEHSPLKTRSFERETPITSSYKVSSFSSLTSWMDEDPNMPDYDQFLDISGADKTIDSNPQEKSMFTFPRGPQPGTCIHNIFENINFSELNDSSEVIKNNLAIHGINQQWIPVVREMIDIVVNKPLLPSKNNLKLAVLQTSDLIPEMEFYYRNKDISTRQLLSIIREENIPTERAGKALEGFLKGFIDLTFRIGNKYYLLDYKTNYLGNSLADYSEEKLREEMLEASYDLQYHIYTIALHRFLKKKMADYSYEQNFGGVFYLFLRGMNQNGSEGIYYDRPPKSTIQKLDEFILEGGEG